MTKRAKLQVVPQAPRVKTFEERLSDAWENIVHTIGHEVKWSQEKLDKWSLRFAENPADAFEWSSEIFCEAARNRVSKEVQAWINNAMKQGDEYVSPNKLDVMKEVRKILYGEVMRKAKWPEHSTSQPHNIIHTELLSKRAEWLEMFDRQIERIEKE